MFLITLKKVVMSAKITKGRKFFNRKRQARILPSVILSLAVSLTLFIVNPLEILSSNASEFRFVFADFMWWLFLIAGVFAVINFSLLYFTPIIVNRIVYGFLIGLLLMLFMQGNYLNAGLTLSGDGTSGAGVSFGQMVFNAIVWLLVFALFVALVLFVRKSGVVRALCFFLSAIILLISLITMTVNIVSANKNQADGILQRKEASGDENYQPRFLTYKNISTLSEEGNVIIFCIDRFDGLDNAEPEINNNSAFFNDLDGFTYFNDHISKYGHTYPSTTYMLTGVEHDNSHDRAMHFRNAYENNNTLKILNDNGYAVNVYTDYYYSYDDVYYMPNYLDNVIETDINNTHKVIDQKMFLSLRMMQLGLYRCMPMSLKTIVGGSINSATCNGYVRYSAYNLTEPEYTTDMKEAFNRVKNGVTLRTDGKKNFSFIHVSGCHSVPYSETWERASRKESKDTSISVRNSFRIIKEYVKEMKRLGIYKDATIIITGDHADPKFDYGKIDGPRLTALFVKPSGEGENVQVNNATLKISPAQVSHENLWGTIFKSEGISVSGFKPSVFDISETENQTRTYLWDYHDRAYTKYWECKYQIVGSARDINNWTISEEDIVLVERDLYD